MVCSHSDFTGKPYVACGNKKFMQRDEAANLKCVIFFSLRYVGSIIDDFEKIYKLQDEGIAFKNLTGLLSAMNSEFPKILKISTKEHLTNLGYSSQLIDELVEAALVVSYGQSTGIQSFVGLVAVAGTGASLWSVKGGNRNVKKTPIFLSSFD